MRWMSYEEMLEEERREKEKVIRAHCRAWYFLSAFYLLSATLNALAVYQTAEADYLAATFHSAIVVWMLVSCRRTYRRAKEMK